jgi:hypothetical protein
LRRPVARSTITYYYHLIKAQLLDALDRAHTLLHSCGQSFKECENNLREMATLFEERTSRITTCAHELLVAMKGGDVFDAARRGDWEPLKAALEEGHRPGFYYLVEEDLIDFLLKVLEGKRRPKSRPASVKIAVRNRNIIWFVITERERGVKDDPSIENAAKMFNLGKRSIYGIASSKALDGERPILARVRALQQDIDDLIAKLTVYHETKCALSLTK